MAARSVQISKVHGLNHDSQGCHLYNFTVKIGPGAFKKPDEMMRWLSEQKRLATAPRGGPHMMGGTNSCRVSSDLHMSGVTGAHTNPLTLNRGNLKKKIKNQLQATRPADKLGNQAQGQTGK